MKGEVFHPAGADGLVILASGPEEQELTLDVAHALQASRLATFILEPLTDVPVLTTRIVAAADWVATFDRLAHLSVGCFGAGQPGAESALLAAAERPWGMGATGLGAVVVRADGLSVPSAALQRVRVPTLVIGSGFEQLELVHEYSRQLPAMDSQEVAILSRAWFARHLGRAQVERVDQIA